MHFEQTLKMWLVEDFAKCVADLQLPFFIIRTLFQVVLIEVKNEDGTWPGQHFLAK